MTLDKNRQQYLDFMLAWQEEPLKDRIWRKYVIRDGVLYYKHLALIPFASIDSTGDILVDFNHKLKKQIYDLVYIREYIPKCKIIFVQYLFPEKENIVEYDLRYAELWAMITVYLDWDIHQVMNQIGYSIYDAVLDYVIKYDCVNIFYDVNTNEIEDYRDSIQFSNHTYWNVDIEYVVHPEVNEATLNLVKQVKMGILFNNYGL